MNTKTTLDNQALLAFWNQTFLIPEEEKEAARREGIGGLEELAPSKKLFDAVCNLGSRKKVLDYGCGNGWAAVIAAKSGCPDVTAADLAPNAVDAAKFLSELLEVTDRVHTICINEQWLKNVPSDSYDGLFCSNVLDVVPPETAEEILREIARVATEDAEVVISLNEYLAPETAAEKGEELTADRALYIDGVLRLVSRSDEEWAAFFAPFFHVEGPEYFAWPGETEEKRRIFRLHKRQSVCTIK